MKTGRKGYAEELRIKESLAEITPKMFAFVNEVMESGTKGEKMQVVTKILPKIIPQQVDLTSGGKPLPLLAGKSNGQNYHGDAKIIEAEQENPGS